MRAAFDFETWEWINPLMVGFAWKDEDVGEVETHYVLDPKANNPEGLAEQALLYMLSRTEIDEWWTHNGGKFDGLFLVAAAQRLGWDLQAHVAGGSRAIYL